MPDIFLSYNREDQTTARKFAEGFERAGFSVWWDVTLRSGEAYDRVTEQALREARAVVVLWSRKSVESRWVRAEATQADRNKTLMPVMIEPCQRPIMFELTQTADLIGWTGNTSDAAWQAFLADVRHLISKPRETVMAEGAAASASATLTPHPQPWHHLPKVRWLAGAIALVVSAAAGYGVLRPVNELPSLTAVAPPASVPASTVSSTATQDAVPAMTQTLAILPFTNLSSDVEQEYFSDGLTEELINTLSSVDGLLVTGRTSAFFYKNSALPLSEISSALNVRHVLQGSVRKAGTQLRIAVTLTEAGTGFNLWTQTWDRQLDDIFAVQEEIAEAVATALSVTFGAGSFDRAGMTRNVEAYEEFLLARKYGSAYSIVESIAHAEKAVALDPGFALGWRLLAQSYSQARIYLPPDQTMGYEAKVADAKAKAVALAPEMPELDLDRVSQLGLTEHNYLAAEKLLQEYSAVYDLDARFNARYSAFMFWVGRYREGIAYAEKAYSLDPSAASDSSNMLGRLSLNAHVDPEIVRAIIADGIALGGSVPVYNANLAFLEMDQGNWDAALAATQNMVATKEVQSQMLQYVIDNKSDEGLTELRKWLTDKSLTAALRGRHLPAFAALFGDVDLALEFLQGADDLPDIGLDFFSDVRRHPGFKTLVEKKGLLNYWRTSGHWPDYCRPLNDDFECF